MPIVIIKANDVSDGRKPKKILRSSSSEELLKELDAAKRLSVVMDHTKASNQATKEAYVLSAEDMRDVYDLRVVHIVKSRDNEFKSTILGQNISIECDKDTNIQVAVNLSMKSSDDKGEKDLIMKPTEDSSEPSILQKIRCHKATAALSFAVGKKRAKAKPDFLTQSKNIYRQSLQLKTGKCTHMFEPNKNLQESIAWAIEYSKMNESTLVSDLLDIIKAVRHYQDEQIRFLHDIKDELVADKGKDRSLYPAPPPLKLKQQNIERSVKSRVIVNRNSSLEFKKKSFMNGVTVTSKVDQLALQLEKMWEESHSARTDDSPAPCQPPVVPAPPPHPLGNSKKKLVYPSRRVSIAVAVMTESSAAPPVSLPQYREQQQQQGQGQGQGQGQLLLSPRPSLITSGDPYFSSDVVALRAGKTVSIVSEPVLTSVTDPSPNQPPSRRSSVSSRPEPVPIKYSNSKGPTDVTMELLHNRQQDHRELRFQQEHEERSAKMKQLQKELLQRLDVTTQSADEMLSRWQAFSDIRSKAEQHKDLLCSKVYLFRKHKLMSYRSHLMSLEQRHGSGQGHQQRRPPPVTMQSIQRRSGDTSTAAQRLQYRSRLGRYISESWFLRLLHKMLDRKAAEQTFRAAPPGCYRFLTVLKCLLDMGFCLSEDLFYSILQACFRTTDPDDFLDAVFRRAIAAVRNALPIHTLNHPEKFWTLCKDHEIDLPEDIFHNKRQPKSKLPFGPSSYDRLPPVESAGCSQKSSMGDSTASCESSDSDWSADECSQKGDEPRS